MGRLVTIDLECDWPECGHREPETATDSTIHEVTLAMNATKPRLFLLCVKHREELIRIIHPLLDAGLVANKVVRAPLASTPDGVANPNSRKPSIVHPCQVEGCGRDIRGRVGMAQHVPKVHGMTLDDYETQYGKLASDHRT